MEVKIKYSINMMQKGIEMSFVKVFVISLISASFFACGPNLVDKKISNYDLDVKIKKQNKDDVAKKVARDFEGYNQLLADGNISLQQYARNLYSLQEEIYSVFPASDLSEVSKGICILYIKEEVAFDEVSVNKDLIEYKNKIIRSKADDIEVSLCDKFFKDNLGEAYVNNPSKFALTTSVRSNMK